MKQAEQKIRDAVAAMQDRYAGFVSLSLEENARGDTLQLTCKMLSPVGVSTRNGVRELVARKLSAHAPIRSVVASKRTQSWTYSLSLE